MSFKLYKCESPSGLPLIEVPDGRFVFERLSPGEIREADYYEEFRWGDGGKKLFACPRGKSEKGRCKEPLRLLRIRHNRKALKGLLRDCRSGELYNRRKGTIDKILKDVEKKSSSKSALGAVSAGNRIGSFLKFIAIGVFTTVAAAYTIKFMFPGYVGGHDVR